MLQDQTTKKLDIMDEPKCKHKVLQAKTYFMQLKRTGAQKKLEFAPSSSRLTQITPGNELVGKTMK